MSVNDERFNDEYVAVEPRNDSKTFNNFDWPPSQFVKVIAGRIRLTNDTKTPINIQRNDHLCQIRSSKTVEVVEKSTPIPKTNITKHMGPFSDSIVIDPSNQFLFTWICTGSTYPARLFCLEI